MTTLGPVGSLDAVEPRDRLLVRGLRTPSMLDGLARVSVAEVGERAEASPSCAETVTSLTR